jgi:hypothetical protein
VTPETAPHTEPDLDDPIADSILSALEICPDGATRWSLSNLLGRNKSAAELDRAITLLLRRGRIGFEREATGGRPCATGGRPCTRYWLADEESRRTTR